MEAGAPTLEYNARAIVIPIFLIFLGFLIILLNSSNSMMIVIGSLIVFVGLISLIALSFILIQLRAAEARIRREFLLRQMEEEEEKEDEYV